MLHNEETPAAGGRPADGGDGNALLVQHDNTPAAGAEPETLTVLQVAKGRTAQKTFSREPTSGAACKAADYDAGHSFFFEIHTCPDLSAFAHLLRRLERSPAQFVIRGRPVVEHIAPRALPDGRAGFVGGRRLVRIHGAKGTVEDAPRRLFCVDVDDGRFPAGMSCTASPCEAAAWVRDTLLPPEFKGTACVFQFSSSAALTAEPEAIKLHLWFWCAHPLSCDDLRGWARWWNDSQGRRVVDPALYNPVQPHYTAAPRLEGGLRDPFGAQRSGLLPGREAVDLSIPSAEHRRAATERRRKEAVAHAKKHGASGAAAVDAESGLIRFGDGAGGFLAALGYGGDVRRYLLAAVGAYFHAGGSGADPADIRRLIVEAIEDSPWLECGEIWSRPREDARRYLGSGNVDEMIRDIARREAAREAAEQAAPMPYPEPGVPLAEAEAELSRIVGAFFAGPAAVADAERQAHAAALDAYGQALRDWHARQAQRDFTDLTDTDAAFQPSADDPEPQEPAFAPPQWAVNVTPGAGKTHRTLKAIKAAAAHGLRGVYFAPTHDKLEEAVTELAEIPGGAAVYRGMLRPDPDKPGVRMCRRPEDAAAVSAAGGSIADDLCPSCCFWPDRRGKTAAGESCGRSRQTHQRAAVWALPTAMLARPRPENIPAPDFVVIDEALHGALVADGTPRPGADDAEAERPDTALTVAQAAADRPAPADASDAERERYSRAVACLRAALDAATPGHFLDLAPAVAEGLSVDLARLAERLEWRQRQPVRDIVARLDGTVSVAKALGPLTEGNRLGDARRRLWGLVANALEDGQTSCPFVTVRATATGPALRMAWRAEIHPSWLEGPVLHLDGTLHPEIARRWLSRLEVKADIRVEAPHAWVRLVTGRAASKTTMQEPGNLRRLAHWAETMAYAVSADSARRVGIISYKSAVAAMRREHGARLSLVETGHFAALRGLNRMEGVTALAVIGRPLPPTDALEALAGAIFGRVPRVRLQGGPLPSEQRLARVRDGSGIAVRHSYHPDPDVDAVLYAIRDAELLQAVHRARGIRRGERTPVLVLVAADVCLDITAADAVTWDATFQRAWEARLAVARGILPDAWPDLARVLPDLHETAEADWAKRGDHFGRTVRRRPEAVAELEAARSAAKVGQNPYRVLYGDCPTFAEPPAHAWARVEYRRPGNRKRGAAYLDPVKHPDRRAAVADLLEAELLRVKTPAPPAVAAAATALRATAAEEAAPANPPATADTPPAAARAPASAVVTKGTLSFNDARRLLGVSRLRGNRIWNAPDLRRLCPAERERQAVARLAAMAVQEDPARAAAALASLRSR